MLQENEKWIEGYEERYSITKDGRAFSHIRGRKEIGKNQPFCKARNIFLYKLVNIAKKGEKQSPVSIHRLVAETFLPNPENKPCVNHIDGDKANNKLENLEWVTYSENTQHMHDNDLWEMDRAKITERQNENLDSFIFDGKGYTRQNSIKLLSKERLELNNIPGDILDVSIVNGSPLNTWNYYIDLFRICDSELSLSQVSKITDLDPSMISLVRSGKRAKKARDIYDKYGKDPKYLINYEKYFK